MVERIENPVSVASLTIIVRQAESSHWPTVKSLLMSAGLPVDDLDEDRLDGFLVAKIDGQVVGVVGLQSFGDTGLLRSLVVREDKRNLSLGRKLVEAVETTARYHGVEDLWLLTIDAERFFEARGYEIVDREQAPEAIRATAEFSSLCPGDAFLMRKMLL